jgi:HAD superfamily hydrolase (TIGR01459 family)
MSDTHAPPVLRGISEFAAAYDAVICDVWGVIHNGRDAFAPAADALRRFRAERGPVVLLSNAPRPPDGVKAQFDRIGVPHDFYDAIVTSGGAARADLEKRTSGGKRLKLFYLGPNRDTPLLSSLDIVLTGEDEADVVLCTGPFNDETETPDDYREMLDHFRLRALPFLCANPDIVVQRGDKLVYCAGALGRAYERMGGPVVWYGKPFAPVFEAALAESRARGPALKPLVIGDGLETDILGANRMGFDALFIAGGIHGAELKQNPEALGALFQKAGVSAAAAMASLAW